MSKSHLDWVPVAATDFLFTGGEFSVGSCGGAALSGWSGWIVEPDGTKEARSGGWSFPTVGLAYREHNFVSSMFCEELTERINTINWTTNYLEVNVWGISSYWFKKLVKIASI